MNNNNYLFLSSVKQRGITASLLMIQLLFSTSIQAQELDTVIVPPITEKPIDTGSFSLNTKIDRNYTELQDIPGKVYGKIKPLLLPNFPVPQPSSVNKTWVGVNTFNYREQENGDRPTLLKYDRTIIHILNTSLNTVTAHCTFFSNSGVLLLDSSSTQEVPSGAKGLCGMSTDTSGWVIVSADQPILVDGYQEISINRNTSASLTIHPIDCTDPTGLEFICQFINN